MSVVTSSINSSNSYINKLLAPKGTNLGTIPNLVPDEGALAFDLTSGALYYGDGGVWQALAATGSPIFISAFGSVPNAFGMTLTGNVLNLQPANQTFPGAVSISAQRFAGVKTFNDGITLSALTTPGVLHNNALGNVSSSLIVDADIDAGAAIVDTKLATLSTPGKVSNLATTATALNTIGAIVTRDGAGNFAAGTITATLNGNATTATSTPSFTGLLSGDVNGTQGATVVNNVGGKNEVQIANSVNEVNAATNLATGNTIVKRSALGDFNARDILAVNFSTGTGNINIPTTASGTIGVIVQNGNRYIHSIGTNCFFAGQLAGNPAFSSGARSTGVGYSALNVALAGADNSAFGYNALLLSTGGTNSAFGSSCLAANTSGVRNTAMGYEALLTASTVNDNVAIGYRALRLQTSGGNTVVGSNSATTATGINNTSLGSSTLFNLTTGTTNIAIGANAGSGLTTGSNNIYIGLAANSATDASVCKIASIRGITTASATGIAVLIDTNGQLGTVSSTRAKKENIIAMDPIQNSDIIRKLQPRRFDYKSGKGEYQQYGLIVDEVEKVCPDLIAKKSDGTPETIYYNHLPMILLQEVQTLRNELDALKFQIEQSGVKI